MIYYTQVDTKRKIVKMKKSVFAVVVALTIGSAFPAGLGIYEASSRGNALGGTLVGSTKDATAVYYNPANMSEMTNAALYVGTTFINPYCDTEVDHVGQPKMNAGWFTVPTFYATVPLPFDFWFGLGGYSEYGLGTKYGEHWALAGDTVKTTIEQYSINPALAYRITDWWSVAAGLRISYVDFKTKKHPYEGNSFFYEPLGLTLGGYPDAYHLSTNLKGDDMSLGYNLATSFRITDSLSLGIHYRSRIEHQIKGHFNLAGDVDTPAGSVDQGARRSAKFDITAPQSATVGLNYEILDTWRIGGAATWTEWSTFDAIDFKIPGYGYKLPLKWRDVWRFGIGSEYDVCDALSLRLSYVYDVDPTCHHGTTMLPSGNRQIIGFGLGWWILDNLRLDLGYSFIVMHRANRFVNVNTPSGDIESHRFSTDNGYSHLVSVGVAYMF